MPRIRAPIADLSRREREILDIIYRRGSATAAEVTTDMADPPTYTTVRGLLRALERKRHIRHYEDGARYVYKPVRPRQETGRQMLSHILHTFFDGSTARAMASLIGSDDRIDERELAELETLLRRARARRR